MCLQLDAESIGFSVTAKPVLSDQSKIDKKTILMTNGSLMKVESTVLQNAPPLEHSAILLTFPLEHSAIL